ncbi:phytanoyl-CoA dioxygenase family protein [Kutzneria sp. CA-103260]|uniref:phytanoyl-CoA dioxygenase family protein n=1 Tax=Kutzneria sp. CA-103260 TaxID=2802641 RepID=UPI001BA57B5E|nr:phytanoyl-CoA dioxygenase family protein [Kutzneria sp. CA-103260]QUQ65331.1 Phytanoyl-CoA dioxygenase (PhyH) [Kutzneria sp. CA-103260]
MTTRTWAPLTDEETVLLPTGRDMDHYRRRGWYLSERLFTDNEVDELAAAADAYYAGHRDRELPVRPARLAAWRPADGDVQRNNDYIHYTSDLFLRLLSKPVVGAVAAALARTDTIRIFQATLLFKPAMPDEPTNIVSWHFDKYYWSTCSSDNMLTAFIPLHDCDERFGTLTMIDGSHRWAHRHGAVRPRTEPSDLAREGLLELDAAANGVVPERVPVHIPKGHMTFHHCLLYHGSGPNRAAEPRRSISLHLQDGANAYRPFTLSPGRQEPYKHDWLVRRTAEGSPDYADPDFCPRIWPLAPGQA